MDYQKMYHLVFKRHHYKVTLPVGPQEVTQAPTVMQAPKVVVSVVVSSLLFVH